MTNEQIGIAIGIAGLFLTVMGATAGFTLYLSDLRHDVTALQDEGGTRDAPPPSKPKPGSSAPSPIVNDAFNSFSSSIQERLNSVNCGVDFNVKFTQLNPQEGAVSFSINTSGNFHPSGYYIADSYQKDCLISSIGFFVREVKKRMDADSFISVDGKFAGMADGSGGIVVGVYKGEFNSIVRDGVLINGVSKNVVIQPNKKITNEELAFLRAYSLYSAFISLSSSHFFMFKEGDIDFFVDTTKKLGREHRLANVEIRVNLSKVKSFYLDN